MMTSALSGFFSQNLSDIEAALSALGSPRGDALPEVSNADVPIEPGRRIPPQGLWSEPIFGPRDMRNPEAWAKIPLAVPALHPASLAPIAERLGLTYADVLAVAEERAWLELEPNPRVCFPPEDTEVELVLLDQAEGKSGVDGILAALERYISPEESKKWTVLAFPIPPVIERPLERRPGGCWVAGARNTALADILFRNERTRRLMELNAPNIIIRGERVALMRELKRAIALYAGEEASEALPPSHPPEELRCEMPDLDTPQWPIPEKPEQLLEVCGLCFAGPGRALIDFPTTTFEIDLTSGALLSVFRSGGLRLLGLKDGIAVFTGHGSWEFRCWSAVERVFLHGPLPQVLPFVFEEHMEISFVVEVATGRRIRLKEVGDYPTHLRLSPCMRYMMATDKHGEGGVFRYDGELQFPFGYREPEVLRLLEGHGFRTLEERERDRFEENAREYGGELLAFVLDEKRDIWRKFEGNGVVEGRNLRFCMPKPVAVAAFDEKGERCLCASKDTLMLVEGLGGSEEQIHLRAEFDLKPLLALLGATLGLRRSSVPAVNVILHKYGTLAALGDASLKEIQALNMASPYDEPRRIGRDRAKRLLAKAKQVQMVSVLSKI